MSTDRTIMFQKLAASQKTKSPRSAFFSQLAGTRAEGSHPSAEASHPGAEVSHPGAEVSHPVQRSDGHQSRQALFQSIAAKTCAADRPVAVSNHAAGSSPSDSEHLSLELIEEEVAKAASALPAMPKDDLRSKRPHYNSKRRKAKAAAAAAVSLKKPMTSDQKKRMDQNRVQELVNRECCDCSRGTCWNQFKPVFATLMAVMAAFATAAKGVRDEILRILG